MKTQKEVIEEDSSRCKVHYVGYCSSYDELKNKDEIVDLTSDHEDAEATSHIIQIFSLCNELAIRIKSALGRNLL